MFRSLFFDKVSVLRQLHCIWGRQFLRSILATIKSHLWVSSDEVKRQRRYKFKFLKGLENVIFADVKKKQCDLKYNLISMSSHNIAVASFITGANVNQQLGGGVTKV